MPQLDKVTYFTQVFWVLIIFLGFYVIVLEKILPSIAARLKTRKKITEFYIKLISSLNYEKELMSYFSKQKLNINESKNLLTKMMSDLLENVEGSINKKNLLNLKNIEKYIVCLIILRNNLFK